MKIKGFNWGWNNLRVGDFGEIHVPISLRSTDGVRHVGEVVINGISVHTMFLRAIVKGHAEAGPVTVVVTK